MGVGKEELFTRFALVACLSVNPPLERDGIRAKCLTGDQSKDKRKDGNNKTGKGLMALGFKDF